MFEEMLDAELRLLDRRGGSIELAVLDAEISTARASLQSSAQERLFLGALNERRIAVFKRGLDSEAGRELGAVIQSLRSRANVQAVGMISLAAKGLHVLNAAGLLRLAQSALDRTLATSGSGLHRLVIEERVSELGPQT